MTYTVAVRELCEFTAKQGDLDLRFTPAPTALEGMAGHAVAASRRGAGYRAEVALSGSYQTLRVRGRGQRDEPVLAWAEVGRTDGLGGTLAGLSGAPVLDRQGRAIGVTIAESPRRGRIYTTAPDTFGPAIRGVQKADEPLTGRIVTVDNYGLVADDLRRELRVAQVVCLSA